MFKRKLKPLTKGGQTTQHVGKGSQMASMPARSEIASLAKGPMNTMNDYAKATPMAEPSPSPMEGGFE